MFFRKIPKWAKQFCSTILWETCNIFLNRKKGMFFSIEDTAYCERGFIRNPLFKNGIARIIFCTLHTGETKFFIYGNDIFLGRSDLMHVMQSGTPYYTLVIVTIMMYASGKIVTRIQVYFQTWKNTKSLHNLNSIYFSYKSLFLAFTKEIAGNMKKCTQIWKITQVCPVSWPA